MTIPSSSQISFINSIKEHWRVYKRSQRGVIGLGILILFMLLAIFAPLITPYDPFKRVDQPLLPPSKMHVLGTNDIGQDIISELIYGARISLMIGFLVAISTVFLGTLI